MKKINAGIVGYGNLGKGVELALSKNQDFELQAIFTRRNPCDVKSLFGTSAFNIADIYDWKGRLDILILCGGSATDLPIWGPKLLQHFNTVDSFDTHPKIPEYFAKMDAAGISGNNLGLISIGWDPGLFSVMRALFSAVLPGSNVETFWGPGVSQGHSDAIRRIPGVIGGVQYTIPREQAIAAAQAGEKGLSSGDKHRRECYVAVQEDADKTQIEKQIKQMPAYFADYDTTVNFISLQELKEQHSEMPHGGTVLAHGITGDTTKQVMQFILNLQSNPEFTASVIVAYARAAVKMSREGAVGAKTIFDIPLTYISADKDAELRANLL